MEHINYQEYYNRAHALRAQETKRLISKLKNKLFKRGKS